VQSVKEIFDFAIDREQQAVDFYKKLSAMAPGKQSKKLLTKNPLTKMH
jgi:rubrerythrin